MVNRSTLASALKSGNWEGFRDQLFNKYGSFTQKEIVQTIARGLEINIPRAMNGYSEMQKRNLFKVNPYTGLFYIVSPF